MDLDGMIKMPERHLQVPDSVHMRRAELISHDKWLHMFGWNEGFKGFLNFFLSIKYRRVSYPLKDAYRDMVYVPVF